MILFKIESCVEDGVDNVTGWQDDFAGVVKICGFLSLYQVCCMWCIFCMASCLMDCTKDESGISVLGGCSDVVTSNYTCILCAHSLQILLI